MEVETLTLECRSVVVKTETDLWQAPEWAERNGGNVRVVQSCVGPYGAIDQNAGTTYFDIGDRLISVNGQIVSTLEVPEV